MPGSQLMGYFRFPIFASTIFASPSKSRSGCKLRDRSMPRIVSLSSDFAHFHTSSNSTGRPGRPSRTASPGQTRGVHRAAALAAAAATRWGPTSGRLQERRAPDHRRRDGRGIEHTSNPWPTDRTKRMGTLDVSSSGEELPVADACQPADGVPGPQGMTPGPRPPV